MDVWDGWCGLLSWLMYALIGFMCWNWLDCSLTVDICIEFWEKSIWEMTLNAKIVNSAIVDRVKIMIRYTSCWLSESLVTNGCHDHEILTIQVFIVNRTLECKIRNSY